MSAKLSAGETVLVIKFKKIGVIVELVGRTEAIVRVGELNIRCKLGELGPTNARTEKVVKGLVSLPDSIQTGVQARIDLHGLTVAQALKATEERINRAVLAGLEKIEIVHGIGSGKVKESVHRYLGQLTVIKRFAVDQRNAGVTWVWF